MNVLVNNAGATWGAPLADYPAAAWDKVVDLNLKAPFFLTRAFLPLLEAAGTDEDPPDHQHREHRRPASAAVPDVRLLGQQGRAAPPDPVLARELGPRRITVNAVAPGPFESKMMAATLTTLGDAIADAAPLKWIGRPDDMAGVATTWPRGRAPTSPAPSSR